MNKRIFTYNEALEKLMTYCSNQERCAFDVKKKTISWGINSTDTEKLILALREENFINDSRYIEAYIKGKHTYNKWGSTKIKYNLKSKGFSETVITNSIEDFYATINLDDFLFTEILKKNNTIKDDDFYNRKAKLIRFSQSRGYDLQLSLSCIQKILDKN